MSSSMDQDRVLTLKCSDGMEFTVKGSVVVQSVAIKNLIKDHHPISNSTIPMTIVDSETLPVVLEYLNVHGDSRVSDDDKKKFDSEFLKKYDLVHLVFLLFAAYNLEIEDLLRLVAHDLADRNEIFTAKDFLKVFDC